MVLHMIAMDNTTQSDQNEQRHLHSEITCCQEFANTAGPRALKWRHGDRVGEGGVWVERAKSPELIQS